jgi:hypothetical protein
MSVEGSTFIRLASNLTVQERNELLDKLRHSESYPGQIDYREEEQDETVDVRREYQHAGLLVRLIVFLISVFTGKDRLKVMEERLLKKLSQRLARDYPGFMDHSEGTLLSSFFNVIETLQKTAYVFKPGLKTALEDDYEDFIIFLAEMEYPILHEKLTELVDPANFSSELLDENEKGLRKKLTFELDSLLMEIMEGDRESVARHIRMLNKLKLFSDFPFSRFISGGDGKNVSAARSVGALEEPLRELCDALDFMRRPLDIESVETLYLFLYRDEQLGGETGLEEKLETQFMRVKNAFESIFSSMKRVPFISLVKYATRDINYRPTPVMVKGEWLAYFKNYWYDRLERAIRGYVYEGKKRKLINETKIFLDKVKYPFVGNYHSGSVSPYLNAGYQYRVGFLIDFVRKFVLDKHKHVLQRILIDGEFYKEQNRSDFADAYNAMLSIPDSAMNAVQPLW